MSDAPVSTDPDALRARAAAAGVHTIPVPTPFAVGKVNCYLIEDDPLTLVDTGPNWGTALVVLEAGLKALGHRIEDLDRIVLTHQHLDHIGLTRILADRSGAEICAYGPLGPWLERYGQAMEEDDQFADELMCAHGVPRDVVVALRAITAMARAFGARGHVDRALLPGDALPFANRNWEVLHRPGHSPSDTVFHDADRKLLVAGDHLLAHISSNPLISRPLEGEVTDRPHALETYRRSLRDTRAMDLELVVGGHGDPVTDHVALIDERFAQTDRRARKIAGLLRDGGAQTAFQLAQQMWGSIALQQAYLTLSEVIGHLDLLVGDGQAIEHPREGDGPVTFGPA